MAGYAAILAENTTVSSPDAPSLMAEVPPGNAAAQMSRFYFIVDGESITGAYPDDQVAEESEKLMTWGRGMTAFLPKEVKLFADRAIFSQAMQMKGAELTTSRVLLDVSLELGEVASSDDGMLQCLRLDRVLPADLDAVLDAHAIGDGDAPAVH